MSQIYTYSLIKALYDKSKDFLDTIAPLVLQSIPTEKYADVISIQSEVAAKFEIEIPLHLIKAICGRAHRANYIESRNSGSGLTYTLTKSGVDHIDQYENVDEVNRRLEALISDVQSYFNEKNQEKTHDQIISILQRFLDTNLEFFVDLINPQASFDAVALERKDENILASYLIEAKKGKPEQFKVLKEIIHGSLISGLVYTKDTSELTELETRKFQRTQLFLDSNFIFSVLGFHSIEQNNAATELLKLIRDEKFELWVFDFTVEEICFVLQSYGIEKNKYASHIAVDSIFNTLSQKGYGQSDIMELVASIDELLYEKGIRVYSSTDVNLHNYNNDSEDLRGKLVAHKPVDKPLSSINHDLAAVDFIRKIRKGPVRKIEQGKAYFLTSDVNLHRSDLRAYNHVESGTIAETILDTLLANILWIKKPDLEVPIDLVIASNSRSLLIDRKVWDRFYAVLNSLKQRGKVTLDQAANLFYHNQIEESLKKLSSAHGSQITDAMVMEEIEKASKKVIEDNATLATEKEMLEKELLAVKTTHDTSEKDRILELRQTINGIRMRSQAATIWAIVAITFITSTILTFAEGSGLLYAYHHVDNLSLFLAIIALMLGGSGLISINFAVVLFLNKVVQLKIENKIFTLLKSLVVV